MRFYFDRTDNTELAARNAAYADQYANVTFACTQCGSEETEETAELVPSGAHHKVKCANGHVTNGMPPRASRNSAETRDIHGTTVRFFQVGGDHRWVFAGSRYPGGYKTIDDAATEATMQLTGQYQGSLTPAGVRVPAKLQRASAAALSKLSGQY